MVKLNFLSTPPISSAYDDKVEAVPQDSESQKIEEPKIEEPRPESAKDDFADSLFEFDEKPEPVAEPVEEIAETAPVQGTAEKKTPEEQYPYYADDGFGIPWKKYVIISAAAIFLIVLGYFLTKLILGLANDDQTTTVPKRTQQDVTAGEKVVNESETPADEGLSQLHQENIKQNLLVYKNIQNLLKQPSSAVSQSLMVLTPPQVQITVLANSRDDIAEYHMEMKNNYPNYGFKIVSVHSVADNGSAKFAADLIGNLPVSRAGAPGGLTGITISLSALQREIKKVAGQANVRVTYYKQGLVGRNGSCNCYLSLAGETGNILNFFDLFARTLPQTKLHKVSLNKQKRGSGIQVRAELSYTQ